jgi:serine protease AprX
VYRALTSIAERTQVAVIGELERLGVDYHPYWVANMIWVRGGMGAIQLLAQRPDVAHLYANPHVALEAPVEQTRTSAEPQGVEWNIALVGAPQVWALGYTGQGVVIGGQDTGFEWDHPALKNQYRGWDGVSADHDYNWYDATADHSTVPVDPFGHGTHTMGTMVGDDGANNQIGMAPGARWVGCRNMDAGGIGSPETYTACYQWSIAPTRVDGSDPRPDLAPDVVNNSWSCPVSEGCTDPDVLLTVVQSVRAAGIVTAHSAGNSGGSGCESIRTPAAIYAESFTVGATDSSDLIAGFSSRGPVTVDGSNRPKPDISAPGVFVRSSVPGGQYDSNSGTSMAAPHVAGLAALLISVQPALKGQVEQIETIIEQTALHIPSTGCSSSGVPNNVYGWGRIDAIGAFADIHRIELDKVASTHLIEPGGILTYTITITHFHDMSSTTSVVLTDTLPAGVTFISASEPYSMNGDTVRWDFSNLEAMGTRSVELVVQVEYTAIGTLTNADYGVRSDDVAFVRGTPVSTHVGSVNYFYLPLTLNSPR